MQCKLNTDIRNPINNEQYSVAICCQSVAWWQITVVQKGFKLCSLLVRDAHKVNKSNAQKDSFHTGILQIFCKACLSHWPRGAKCTFLSVQLRNRQSWEWGQNLISPLQKISRTGMFRKILRRAPPWKQQKTASPKPSATFKPGGSKIIETACLRCGSGQRNSLQKAYRQNHFDYGLLACKYCRV